MESRQTRFSDVCGSIDELKRLLYEEKDKVFKNPEVYLKPLIEDVLFMLSRIENRHQEYKNFTEELRKYVKLMEEVGGANLEKAQKSAEFIQRCIKFKKDFGEAEIEKLDKAAESIRSAASNQERKLRAYKDLVLGAYRLFKKIKGNRNWLLDEQNARVLLEMKYQAWLPPEPHKSKLLQELADPNAETYVIEPSQTGEEPVIQFYESGLIPMSQIRWNPDIKNFHPANFKPGSTGRKYRRQTFISLKQLKDNYSILKISLKTFTPNISKFLVKIDEGNWQEVNNSFLWPLKEGKNTIRAKVVDKIGKEGYISKRVVKLIKSEKRIIVEE